MTKYHISEDGVPRPCEALKRHCRFGGENAHYRTVQEAKSAAEAMSALLATGRLPMVKEVAISTFLPPKPSASVAIALEDLDRAKVHQGYAIITDASPLTRAEALHQVNLMRTMVLARLHQEQAHRTGHRRKMGDLEITLNLIEKERLANLRTARALAKQTRTPAGLRRADHT